MEGELEWADATRSKTIHDKLKHAVVEVGDTMTQEEILIQVLESRLGKQQLEQRKLVEEQQGKIQEQEKGYRSYKKAKKDNNENLRNIKQNK
ncbi:1 4-alpha-glucan-branching enzyme 1 chloroplastic/amyloplastic [Bienertia sinuspersici]